VNRIGHFPNGSAGLKSETEFSPELLNRRNVHPFPARMAANIPRPQAW
jgi:hypothetical protein